MQTNVQKCWKILVKNFLLIFTFIKETVISELDEEKGNFLCGPEWKVKITTKAGQDLDIKQVILFHFKLKLNRDLNSLFLIFRLKMVLILEY